MKQLWARASVATVAAALLITPRAAGAAGAATPKPTTTAVAVIPTTPRIVPGQRLSRQDLIRQGDAICRLHTAKFRSAVYKKFPKNAPKGKDLDLITTTILIPTLAEQYKALFALPPPARYEKLWHDLDDASTTALTKLAADPPVAGQPTPVNPFKNFTATMKAFGFEVCK